MLAVTPPATVTVPIPREVTSALTQRLGYVGYGGSARYVHLHEDGSEG